MTANELEDRIGDDRLEADNASIAVEEPLDVSLVEFLPLDAVEDDLDVAPDAVGSHAADAELHRVAMSALLDDGRVGSIDVDALDARLAIVPLGARTGRPRTEIAEELADETASVVRDEHELAVDEILDVTTHSHDPARDHDWASETPSLREESERGDALPEPRHRGEFVCRSCFLVRAGNLRAAGRIPLCIDCAPDDAALTTSNDAALRTSNDAALRTPARRR